MVVVAALAKCLNMIVVFISWLKHRPTTLQFMILKTENLTVKKTFKGVSMMALINTLCLLVRSMLMFKVGA